MYLKWQKSLQCNGLLSRLELSHEAGNYLMPTQTSSSFNNLPLPTYFILINFCPRFFLSSLFEASQSLFWASFGMVGLDSFELIGIKTYTRFWGLLMFGSYSVINVIVLLNLLIAMVSSSIIQSRAWNYANWFFSDVKLIRCDYRAIRHRVEVRTNQAVDVIFWRISDAAASIQLLSKHQKHN